MTDHNQPRNRGKYSFKPQNSADITPLTPVTQQQLIDAQNDRLAARDAVVAAETAFHSACAKSIALEALAAEPTAEVLAIEKPDYLGGAWVASALFDRQGNVLDTDPSELNSSWLASKLSSDLLNRAHDARRHDTGDYDWLELPDGHLPRIRLRRAAGLDT